MACTNGLKTEISHVQNIQPRKKRELSRYLVLSRHLDETELAVIVGVAPAVKTMTSVDVVADRYAGSTRKEL